MPPPGLRIGFRLPVTLTFDLLTFEVDHYMPLPRGSLMPMCTEIGSFIFKISRSQFGNGRTNERMNGRTGLEHYASGQSRLTKR